MNSQNQNLLIAIALSALILLGFHHFYEVPREEALKQAEAAEQAKGGGDQIAANGDSPSANLSTLSETAAVKPRQEIVAQSPRLKIENPRLYGTLSRTGIRFDDLTLTDYYTALDHQAHVDLLSPSGTESPYYAIFGWVPADSKIAVPGDKTVWTAPAGNQALAPDHPVTMTWDNGQGLLFQRTIALDANYMFTVTQMVKNNGHDPVTLYPYASVVRQGTPPVANRSGFEGALGQLGDRMSKIEYAKLKTDKLEPSDATKISTGGWLGFSDKYWMVVAIPDQAETITAQFRHHQTGDVDIYQTDYRADGKIVAPGETIAETNRLFAGAKQVKLLTAYRDDFGIRNLELAVDWGGWLRFLTKPFFYGIDFLASAIGNFGLGILAFTVVIRIVIFPLAWKTFREMNRMSELAPKMAAIKAKYGATNKEAMQAEILELYQTEKVNPISGCLPMFMQLPIFFALFKVLSTTIEMRQQPFYWYVHDLSVEDPTNVFTLFGLLPDWHVVLFGLTLPPHLGLLPLILGCTMLALQLNGPKIADPVQAKMMLMNPVIFTFFMAHLPVGLVIYYIWSNTISIGQQRFIRWFYRRRYPKPVMLPADPVQALIGDKSTE